MRSGLNPVRREEEGLASLEEGVRVRVRVRVRVTSRVVMKTVVRGLLQGVPDV